MFRKLVVLVACCVISLLGIILINSHNNQEIQAVPSDRQVDITIDYKKNMLDIYSQALQQSKIIEEAFQTVLYLGVDGKNHELFSQHDEEVVTFLKEAFIDKDLLSISLTDLIKKYTDETLKKTILVQMSTKDQSAEEGNIIVSFRGDRIGFVGQYSYLRNEIKTLEYSIFDVSSKQLNRFDKDGNLITEVNK